MRQLKIKDSDKNKLWTIRANYKEHYNRVSVLAPRSQAVRDRDIEVADSCEAVFFNDPVYGDNHYAIIKLEAGYSAISLGTNVNQFLKKSTIVDGLISCSIDEVSVGTFNEIKELIEKNISKHQKMKDTGGLYAFVEEINTLT
jgi:hypothetical protein